jgi:1,4-alpha-glucan branching enzyme
MIGGQAWSTNHDDLRYKNGVIYCLSVGTYMDANGDGVGDFKGLLRRLDYLHGLGITAIWLMPFQPSPGKDDGYDISDYYGVDPRYGTLGDFVEFTHGRKQRGIRVIIRSGRPQSGTSGHGPISEVGGASQQSGQCRFLQ